MIASKKRLGRSLELASREVVMRNLALLNKKRKGKGKVPNKKGNSEGATS